MIHEIRYETPQTHVDYFLPSIFLAGPTVRGNQTHLTSWRFEAVEEFKKQGFQGNLIIPEFVSKTESDKYRYDLPAWEYYGLSHSNVIMFWIPRTRELIGLTTNFEIGFWMARDIRKCIYGRPNDAYRMKYVDIMWELYNKEIRGETMVPDIHDNLPDTVNAALLKLNISRILR